VQDLDPARAPTMESTTQLDPHALHRCGHRSGANGSARHMQVLGGRCRATEHSLT
jgi:hypothetical protein